MDARLADFLELAEQDFIRGWTDWEKASSTRRDSQRRTTLAMLTAMSMKTEEVSND